MEDQKTVKDFLHDFHQNTEGNAIRQFIDDLWECNVENEDQAISLVNARLDRVASWAERLKIVPENYYSPIS